MSFLDPEMSARIGTLQSLDDAIAFRLGRLGLPCQDCAPQGRCAEHARDEALIEGYQERHAAAFGDAVAGLDADVVEQIMRPGDGVKPTAGVLGAAIITRLRELAADGPVLTVLDGRDVLIELDDGAVVEHPLAGSAI